MTLPKISGRKRMKLLSERFLILLPLLPLLLPENDQKRKVGSSLLALPGCFLVTFCSSMIQLGPRSNAPLLLKHPSTVAMVLSLVPQQHFILPCAWIVRSVFCCCWSDSCSILAIPSRRNPREFLYWCHFPSIAESLHFCCLYSPMFLKFL